MLEVIEAWMGLGVHSAEVLIDAQTVIAHRLMGLAGLLPAMESEALQMVAEKAPVFLEAGVAATGAALALSRPDQIAAAALAPIRKQTRANADRLTKGHGGRVA